MNAVPVSLAQCDGRFLLSAAVDQDAIVANILNMVFNAQASGVICVVHDAEWLYVRVEADDPDDVACRSESQNHVIVRQNAPEICL